MKGAPAFVIRDTGLAIKKQLDDFRSAEPGREVKNRPAAFVDGLEGSAESNGPISLDSFSGTPSSNNGKVR